MDINFRKHKLERVFNAERELVKVYGQKQARLLIRRLAVLAAAPTLADVPTTKPERCHALKGNRHGQFAVDLEHPFRLVFTPNHDPLPLKDDGGVNLSRITQITIEAIEDYH